MERRKKRMMIWEILRKYEKREFTAFEFYKDNNLEEKREMFPSYLAVSRILTGLCGDEMLMRRKDGERYVYTQIEELRNLSYWEAIHKAMRRVKGLPL